MVFTCRDMKPDILTAVNVHVKVVCGVSLIDTNVCDELKSPYSTLKMETELPHKS